MATQVLPRQLQDRTRHIHLEQKGDGGYHWTCSECEWNSPVAESGDKGITPIKAIDEFAKHSCLTTRD